MGIVRPVGSAIDMLAKKSKPYSPILAASCTIGHGNSSRSSHSWPLGRRTSAANPWIHSWTWIWSSVSWSENSAIGVPPGSWENGSAPRSGTAAAKLPRGNPREENGAIPSPHTSAPTDLTGLPDPGLRFGDEGRSSEGPHGRGSEASTRSTFTTAGGDMTRTTDIHTASDHSLVSAAAGGDAPSLDELHRRHAPIA